MWVCLTCERSYNNRQTQLALNRDKTLTWCACHNVFDLIKLFSPFGMDYDIVYHNLFMG